MEPNQLFMQIGILEILDDYFHQHPNWMGIMEYNMLCFGADLIDYDTFYLHT